MEGEFGGLRKFERNNPLTFKGRYDPKGAQVWLEEIEKIFRVMEYSDAQKVMFLTHMLAEEAEYWWDNARQGLEVAGSEITWENFMIEFLDKYFLVDVRSKKEIEFLELKQGNMTIDDYVMKFEEMTRF